MIIHCGNKEMTFFKIQLSGEPYFQNFQQIMLSLQATERVNEGHT